MTDTLEQAIAEYIEGRKLAKLEPLEKARDKALKEAATSEQIEAAEQAFSEGAQALEEQFKPENWLTEKCQLAGQLTLATHAAKSTHSGAKSHSVLCDDYYPEEVSRLSSAAIEHKDVEYAVSNASALFIADFLELSVSGDSLRKQLVEGRPTSLAAFTAREELLQRWESDLREVLNSPLTVHPLSKQVFFPLGKEQESYHILVPMVSSVLHQKLYGTVQQNKFSENSQASRKAYYDKKFHDEECVFFPKLAQIKLGGEHPKNVSLLAQKRRGVTYLLNSQPPTFEAIAKPPENETQLLRRFDQATWWHVNEFKSFLANLTVRDNNFKTRYKRDYQYLIPISERVLQQAALLQASFESGWSVNTSLSAPLQAWLDPQAHEIQRQNKDWLPIVSQWLTDWLVRRLQNDKSYKLADVEHRYINKVIKHELTMVELGRTEQGGQ